MVTNQNEIIKKIKSLINWLEKKNIKIEQAILFGSYAKGNQTEISDIDIALVSNSFEGIRFLDKQKINPFLIDLDPRFDVHPYNPDEFNENSRWFVKEIMKTGIKIK